MRIALKEGSLAKQSLEWRPPDPAWAPSGAIERARRQLREADPRLGIWWSPNRRAAHDEFTPGRWRIVEWLPNRNAWETVFYFEGENGEYRFPHVGAILARLAACDQSTEKAAAEAERHNAALSQKLRRERLRILLEHHSDLMERHVGIRQTFGPGYIRRRNVPMRDRMNTNHLRWVREQQC